MKVLVTGGAGFVGSEVVRQLKKKGYEVFATDISRKEGTDYLDVTRLDQILKYLRKNHFTNQDGIIHLAAKVAGKPSLKDPWGYFYTNLLGTLNILEAMRTLKLKYLVFPSSWSTYGSRIKLPITEKTPQYPENPYGSSKKACEALIESYSTLYGIKAVVLRPTMIYGPGQIEKNVLQQIVDSMVEGKKFEIYGKGDHTREFLYVEDAARVFVKGLEVVPNIRSWEIFIVGTEHPVRIRDLAKKASKISKFPIVFRNAPTWAFSQRSDMTKLKTYFKLDPKNFTSLEKGLKNCLAYKRKESRS